MAVDIFKAEEILFDIIEKGHRHEHYDKTVEIKKYAKKILSNDANMVKDMLEALRPNETDEQKKNRVKLYQPFTGIAVAPVLDNINEIWRVDGIKKHIGGIDENRKAKIEAKFKTFHGSDSMHRYIFNRFLCFVAYDPNAWLAFDRQDVVSGSRVADVQILPVEVSSDHALDFRYDRTGELEYFVFSESRMEKDGQPMQSSIPGHNSKQIKKSYTDFNFYGRGFVIHLVEYDPNITTEVDYQAEGYALIEIGSKVFWRKNFQSGLSREVQAIRCEAYPSGECDGKIYELFYEVARPLLNDLLKIKSYFDTTIQKHVFLRRYVYSKRCSYRDAESGMECQKGYLGGVQSHENLCPGCHGTGYIQHASEQDEVHLAAPQTIEGAFELSKMSHYETLPFEIVDKLEDRVNFLVRAVPYVVYNQQVVDVSEVLKSLTATQSAIEKDKQYNKLAPFAEAVSRAWEKVWRITADFYGIRSDQFEADMTYPYDFKMKSVNELVQELSDARGAKAPSYVVEAIVDDILTKQYRNSPAKAAEIRAFQRWKPWTDKMPEEIALIRENRAEDDFDLVLWENFDRIVNEIQAENEQPLFSEMDWKKQRALLEAKVAEILSEIKYKPGMEAVLSSLNPLNREDAA